MRRRESCAARHLTTRTRPGRTPCRTSPAVPSPAASSPGRGRAAATRSGDRAPAAGGRRALLRAGSEPAAHVHRVDAAAAVAPEVAAHPLARAFGDDVAVAAGQQPEDDRRLLGDVLA